MGIKIVSGKDNLNIRKDNLNKVKEKPSCLKKYERYNFLKNLVIFFSTLSSLGIIGYVTYFYARQGIFNLIIVAIWALLMLVVAWFWGLGLFLTEKKLMNSIISQNFLPALGIVSSIKYPESILKSWWIALIGLIVYFIITCKIIE